MKAELPQSGQTRPEPPLKLRLNEDLKQSLKQGQKTRVSAIRLVLSAINYAQMARQSDMTDADVLGVLAREIKQHQESIDAFKKGHRQDLVDKEEAEMAVLQEYMPRQLTKDEIIAEVRKVIAEVGARSLADKGKVMSKLMAELRGKADGREINSVVTELLGS